MRFLAGLIEQDSSTSDDTPSRKVQRYSAARVLAETSLDSVEEDSEQQESSDSEFEPDN